jgi:hypothetical protein
MPVLDFAVPCHLTSIDQRTNAVSLFSIIENVEVVRHPSETQTDAWSRVLWSVEVVSLWRRLPTDAPDELYTQTIFLEQPDGIDIELSRVSFTVPHHRHRIQVQLPPLGELSPGEYHLIVRLDDSASGQDAAFRYPIRISYSSLPVVVRLESEDLEYLSRPVRGQGGFQSLLRKIQQQITGQTLALSIADAERLVRYSRDYGGGGFETRLKRVLSQVREQLGHV